MVINLAVVTAAQRESEITCPPLPQVKLKVSTPDKPRLGALGRGALAVSLDKENR